MGRLHGSRDYVRREDQHELGSENRHQQRKYALSPIYGESDPSRSWNDTRKEGKRGISYTHHNRKGIIIKQRNLFNICPTRHFFQLIHTLCLMRWFRGPIPDSMSSLGDSMAPADSITSLLLRITCFLKFFITSTPTAFLFSMITF